MPKPKYKKGDFPVWIALAIWASGLLVIFTKLNSELAVVTTLLITAAAARFVTVEEITALGKFAKGLYKKEESNSSQNILPGTDHNEGE